MAPIEKPRILCVDDEPNVLEGLRLTLGRKHQVLIATSGAEGLEILEREGPVEVVLSDMRMPGMNGAEFLSRVREVAPDTTRMLLTGQTDLESAIDAVNRGQIFRFLTKPCAPDVLNGTFEQAVRQYRLVTAERDVLERTLVGSVQMLHDVLALATPEAFGRATRVKQYVTELAVGFVVPDHWELETAAMLSQVGFVTLDSEVMDKVNRGQRLTSDEEKLVAAVPAIAERLVAHIPRLEGVRAILSAVAHPPTADASHALPANTVLCARLLRIALEYDRMEARGVSHADAISAMRAKFSRDDIPAIEAFAELRARDATNHGPVALPLHSVRVGMVFADDVRLKSGVLLAPRGFAVTAAFVERARNIKPGTVEEPVLCLTAVPAPAAVPAAVS